MTDWSHRSLPAAQPVTACGRQAVIFGFIISVVVKSVPHIR